MTRTEIREKIESIRSDAQFDGYMSRVDTVGLRGARTWYIQVFDIGLDGDRGVETIILTESAPTTPTRAELLGVAWATKVRKYGE